MHRRSLAAALGIVAIGTFACSKAPSDREGAPPHDAAASAPQTPAGESAATTAPLHGGVVTSTREHRFETVLAPGGLFVYAYTKSGAPAMVEVTTGDATLRLPDGTTKEVTLSREKPVDGEAATYFCPMHDAVVRTAPGVCEPCGGMELYTQDRLAGRVDLASVGPEAVHASIHLRGLTAKEPEVEITQDLTMVAGTSAAPGTPTP